MRIPHTETSRKKALLLLLACASIVSALVSCGNKEEGNTLKIAYIPITHALPVVAVNELPTNERKLTDIELVRFGSWTEIAEAFNNGRVDGAVLLAELAVRARERGVPLKAVALGHHDGNVVVVAPEVNSPADLTGKTIAIPHRLSSHNILLQMVLKKNGISPDKVQLTELPPPEMPAALAEKRIAAYIVAEPFGAKGVASGVGKVLYTSPELWPNSVCCTLVLREEAIKERKGEVEAFLADYAKAADRLDGDRQWAEDVSVKYLKADKKVINQSLQWINFKDLKITRGEYGMLTHWMQTLDLSDKTPLFEEFTDTSLLEAVYAKAGK